MAEEEAQVEETQAEGAETPEEKPKKKGVMLVGGLVGILGLAFAASLMAVPSNPKARTLKGPMTGPLTEDKISVNLSDNDAKRYLQFKLHCEYYAYTEEYYPSRLMDPIYMPRLLDALQRISSSLSVEDVTGKVNQPLVVQEIVKGINPVIFPVHIGKTIQATDVHEDSGLRPGYSMVDARFRGYLDDHVLRMDGPQRTLQIDDGPVVSFEGTETDLEVVANNGTSIFVDVSGYVEDFVGDIPLGIQGHLQNLLIENWILQ